MASPPDGDPGKEWGPDYAGRLARRGHIESPLASHGVSYYLLPGQEWNGCTDATEHVIKLTKSEPCKEWFWWIAQPLIKEVWEHIQEMLDGRAIGPSNSPWCNVVMLVRKKDSTLQFYIDFWRLNNRMEKNSYPMPKMIDTMETMLGSKFFSTMDLKSGFWQVKMAEDSWPYTAFTVSSLGVYVFLRMPFGLCNAPVTFQHLMQNCLGELNLTYALI